MEIKKYGQINKIKQAQKAIIEITKKRKGFLISTSFGPGIRKQLRNMERQ